MTSTAPSIGARSTTPARRRVPARAQAGELAARAPRADLGRLELLLRLQVLLLRGDALLAQLGHPLEVAPRELEHRLRLEVGRLGLADRDALDLDERLPLLDPVAERDVDLA